MRTRKRKPPVAGTTEGELDNQTDSLQHSEAADAKQASATRFRNWSMVAAEAISDRRVSHAAARVLLGLGAYVDTQTGECYPSHQTLANFTGIGLRRIKDHLAELRQLGYVDWKRQWRIDGGYSVNVYTIRFRLAEEAASKPEGQEGSGPSAGDQNRTSGHLNANGRDSDTSALSHRDTSALSTPAKPSNLDPPIARNATGDSAIPDRGDRDTSALLTSQYPSNDLVGESSQSAAAPQKYENVSARRDREKRERYLAELRMKHGLEAQQANEPGREAETAFASKEPLA